MPINELMLEALANAKPSAASKEFSAEVEIVRKVEYSRPSPVFGVLGKKKIVIDQDWARPQQDIDAWLAGDV